MELNEISMDMDVKLDIYDKRPDSLKFKTWTRCHVKIEAIKCLPCFLRINFQSLQQDDNDGESAQLSVSINVPGVTISLAASRTKQYSYGLFWTHNRRECFIYFALDTETSCRKYMKWIKKSIKNLELYRQVFLEQRRNSRGPGLFGEVSKKEDKQKELSAVKDALSALGPLPQIPDANNSLNWSRRVSRASDIYEEIFEGNFPPRLSRRLSRTSIASGIYEEMKPCSPSNIHAIVEEHNERPPPIPPLPPHRKRLNTFETDNLGLLDEIPRSNTNPESELAKKKKYKNVLDNIFGTGRAKRAESVSETQACTMDDIINGGQRGSNEQLPPIYANEILKQPSQCVQPNKRNSFSSPDLSKINFLDTFDEDKIAAFLQLNNSSDLDDHITDFEQVHNDGHNFSSISLDDSAMAPSTSILVLARIHALKSKSGSMESLNVSGLLPHNFNFSACNTSSINLIGSNGAVPSSIQKLRRNKIIMEDELTGYCIMAPILNKKLDKQDLATTTTSSTTSSTTSGYSTGSYCSSTTSSSSAASSNTQTCEINKELKLEMFNNKLTTKHPSIECEYDQVPLRKTPLPVAEADLSNIYENMQTGSPLNGSKVLHENTPPLNKHFSGNLYENLLTIKAAQELEQPLPGHICTSTPTDSPAENNQSPNVIEEQENFYQTPRKSIISVDDKIPSYYPNSCDTVKMKRHSSSNSPTFKQTTPTSHKTIEKEKSSTTTGLKHLVNIKMKRERKENLYISSPQQILEQRKKSSTNSCPASITTSKSKKSANAQKISENVYTVNLANKKSLQVNNNNNNNNTEKSSYNDNTETAQLKEKLHNELLQLALLQNIDFKFDDTTSSTSSSGSTMSSSISNVKTPKQSGIIKLEQAELEYENCYQATKDATRLLHKYATLAPQQSMRIKQQLQHHLQKSSTTTGLKHLVNIKMKRERKENLYISSPQQILEQRKKSSTNSCPASITTSKSKKSANAQKISENVYTVNLANKKSLQVNNNNNNNNTEKSSYNDNTETAQLKEKLHNELLQLALLQNIDFKFDDTTSSTSSSGSTMSSSISNVKTPKQSGIIKLEQAELEYENCYQATKDATRLLHKYATLAPQQSMRIKQQLQHHLQVNQTANQKDLMTQSTKLDSPVMGSDINAAASTLGTKKFASLPRFKKIDFSPLKLKINNVLQRNQQPDF